METPELKIEKQWQPNKINPQTQKRDDIGRPIFDFELAKITEKEHNQNIQKQEDLRTKQRISAAMAAAVKNVEHRERLAKTAAEITREQSGLPKHEQSVEVLADRLDSLKVRRKKLSFFDFSGKRAFDELIKQTEIDLQKAKNSRKFETQRIISETMKPLAPIRELPNSAIENLSDDEAELKVKQLELATLSPLMVWNWARRSRVQNEIMVLKKKTAGKKIAAALKSR